MPDLSEILQESGMAMNKPIKVLAPVGHDVFFDIKRLARAWDYQIKCFFDVGANDGAITRAALTAFADADVFSFEPHPVTFAKLRDSVPGPRVHAFNMALGDKTGEGEFFCYGDNKINSLVPDARFAVRFGQSSKAIKVGICTIDEFCVANRISSIDVLKIDTEGSEFSVIKGASQKLARREIRFVYFEFNDIFEEAGRSGGALFPICDFLYPFGFRFVAVYTDYLVTEGEFFAVHNALFTVPPADARGV
jgi:FkbM family methyltransferase